MLRPDMHYSSRPEGCRHCIQCSSDVMGGSHMREVSLPLAWLQTGFEESTSWPQALPSPTMYYALRRRQLRLQISDAFTKPTIWRECDAHAGPSQLRTSRGLPQLQLQLPAARTNVPPEASITFCYSFCVPITAPSFEASTSTSGSCCGMRRSGSAGAPTTVAAEPPAPCPAAKLALAFRQQKKLQMQGQVPQLAFYKEAILGQPQAQPPALARQGLPTVPLRIEGFHVLPHAAPAVSMD